jgi:hypothetical protein
MIAIGISAVRRAPTIPASHVIGQSPPVGTTTLDQEGLASAWRDHRQQSGGTVTVYAQWMRHAAGQEHVRAGPRFEHLVAATDRQSALQYPERFVLPMVNVRAAGPAGQQHNG